jgi:hypothetical protein
MKVYIYAVNFPSCFKYLGITLFPFIFINKRKFNQIDPKHRDIILNHEYIHIEQQKECLILFFYVWYVIEFLIKCIIYKSWDVAYIATSFEKEAYLHQHNFGYTKMRKRFGWFRYL